MTTCFVCDCKRPNIRCVPCGHVSHARCHFLWPIHQCTCGTEIEKIECLENNPTNQGFGYVFGQSRRGRWCTEETDYAQVLTEIFAAGTITITPDTKLGTFLCRMLQCSSQRLSSKMRIGKRVFHARIVAKGLSSAEALHLLTLHKKLSSLEDQFIAKISHIFGQEESAALAYHINRYWTRSFLQVWGDKYVIVDNEVDARKDAHRCEEFSMASGAPLIAELTLLTSVFGKDAPVEDCVRHCEKQFSGHNDPCGEQLKHCVITDTAQRQPLLMASALLSALQQVSGLEEFTGTKFAELSNIFVTSDVLVDALMPSMSGNHEVAQSWATNSTVVVDNMMNCVTYRRSMYLGLQHMDDMCYCEVLVCCNLTAMISIATIKFLPVSTFVSVGLVVQSDVASAVPASSRTMMIFSDQYRLGHGKSQMLDNLSSSEVAECNKHALLPSTSHHHHHPDNCNSSGAYSAQSLHFDVAMGRSAKRAQLMCPVALPMSKARSSVVLTGGPALQEGSQDRDATFSITAGANLTMIDSGSAGSTNSDNDSEDSSSVTKKFRVNCPHRLLPAGGGSDRPILIGTVTSKKKAVNYDEFSQDSTDTEEANTSGSFLQALCTQQHDRPGCDTCCTCGYGHSAQSSDSAAALTTTVTTHTAISACQPAGDRDCVIFPKPPRVFHSKALTYRMPATIDTFDSMMQGLLRYIPFDLIEIWVPVQLQNRSSVVLLFGGSTAMGSDLQGWESYSRNFTFESKIGLPGRVSSGQRAEIFHDVSSLSQPQFLRVGGAKSMGIHASVGLPIISPTGGQAAVMVFYSKAIFTPTDPLINFLGDMMGSMNIRTSVHAERPNFLEKYVTSSSDMLPSYDI